MKTKTALEFRQQFGKILDTFSERSEPIVIMKNNKPVAAVISYATFQQRFSEYQDHADRRKILDRFRAAAKKSALNSGDVLRRLRYGDE